jgi:hypothetical protein
MVARLEKEIDEWRGSELPYFLNFDMFRGKVIIFYYFNIFIFFLFKID